MRISPRFNGRRSQEIRTKKIINRGGGRETIVAFVGILFFCTNLRLALLLKMAAKRTSGGDLHPEDVINYICENSGAITNHELVRRFRRQLKDPDRGDANKKLLKDVTGKVAVVTGGGEGREKMIALKPRLAGRSTREIYSEYLYLAAASGSSSIHTAGLPPPSSPLTSRGPEPSEKPPSGPRLPPKGAAATAEVPPVPERKKSSGKPDGSERSRGESDGTPLTRGGTLLERGSVRRQAFREKSGSLRKSSRGLKKAIVENSAEAPQSGASDGRRHSTGTLNKKDGKRKSSNVETESVEDKRKAFREKKEAQKSVKDLTRDFDNFATKSQLQLADHFKESPQQTAGYRVKKRNVPVGSGNGGQNEKAELALVPLSKAEREWLLAASRNDTSTVKEQMTKSNARVRDPLSGYTALHWAAKHGNAKLIRKLLDAGASVNQRSRGGYTPLMLAAMQSREAAFNTLLDAPQCDPSLRDYSGKKAKDYLPRAEEEQAEDVWESESGYDGDEDDLDGGGKRKRMREKVDRGSSFLRGFVRETSEQRYY